MVLIDRLFALALLSCAAAAPCKDTAQPNHCADWAANGECTSNTGYMHHHCRMSCNLCTPMDPYQLLTDVDTDNSTTISKSELQARHTKVHEVRMKRETKERQENPKTLPSSESEEEKKDFLAMDGDKSGYLTMNETFGEPEPEELMDHEAREDLLIEKEYDELMFKHADKNRDGILNPEEYVHFRHDDFESLPAFQELTRKQGWQYVERQFKLWDVDKSGDLDEEEVFDALDGGLADFTHPDDVKDEL